MASFSIQWRASTRKDIRKLPPHEIQRVLADVEALAENPFPPGSEKLTGTEHTSPRAAGPTLRVGWSSLLTPEGLALAVSEVAQGRRFLCAKAQATLMDYLGRAGAAGPKPRQEEVMPKLDSREEQVLACLEEGLLYKEITERLHIGLPLLRKLQTSISRSCMRPTARRPSSTGTA